MKKLLYALSCSSVLLAPATANAYLIFFGEDLNSSATAALSSTSNSNAASTSFQKKLSGNAGTENFGSRSTGSTAPQTLNFPRSTTATLTGGNGVARTHITGTVSQGQYSAPSSSSTNYWEATASRSGVPGTFAAAFNQPISAIGFYAIDVGEFGGQLQLEVFYQGTLIETLTVRNPNTLIADEVPSVDGSTDGSVLYYGIIAESPGEQFTDVNFVTTINLPSPLDTETFAFDEFTVDPAAQVVQPNNPIPNPGTLALFGLGLAGLGWSKRKS